ncbi:MAG: hypothetical protein ACI4KF_09480 [Huintestinicola sp.]
MSMKLSYRDKVIIIIATVLVVLIAGFFAFLKPQYGNLQTSKAQLTAKQSEQATIQAKIDTLTSLEETLKTIIKDVEELQKDFVSEKEYGTTYAVGEYLTELLAETDLTVVSTTYTTMSSVPLSAYYYELEPVAYQLKMDSDINNELPPEVGYVFNNTYPSAPQDVMVCGTTVTIAYECSPDITEVLKALNIISEHDKTIYLTTASSKIEYSEEDGGGEAKGEGELVIEVYEIYPMDVDSVK